MVHTYILNSDSLTINDLTWQLRSQTVQPHDETCRNIQNYTRLKNGHSSLGIHTKTICFDGAFVAPFTNQQTVDFQHPLSLTSSFDTKTTYDSSSSSGGEGTSFDDGDGIDHLIENGKIESLFHSAGNGDTIITQLPGDFPIKSQRQKPITKISHSPSILLTREQVLEKLEITKRKNQSIADGSRKTSCDESNERNSNEEDHMQECSICMEGFKIGEDISFSPAEGCHHVFHHDCLRKWLLRKTDCPCCRITMLPIDRPSPKDFCGEETRDEESTHAEVSQTISSSHRLRTYREWRQLFRTRPSPAKKPWYHRNPSVLNERLNKKCGTFCCATCGVVVLKTSLREDLCTKVIPAVQGTGNTTAEL